jgi:flagellar biosynthesis/type III secretory pathway protein FliH
MHRSEMQRAAVEPSAAEASESPEQETRIEVFRYPEASPLRNQPSAKSSEGVESAGGPDAQGLAWADALRDNEERARQRYAAELAQERAALTRALEEFSRRRTAYFLKFEEEAVQLILAIARKVLQREARADPLALAAMVHVALEPLHTGTVVRLRVHPNAAQDWRLYFAARSDEFPSLETLPQVIEDAGIPEGECRLETEMGTAALSLSQQLASIEASFLELLAQRLAVAP